MRKWIIAAGVATAALAWFAPDDDVVPPAAATPRASSPAALEVHAAALAAAPSIPAELQIQRRIDGEEAGNLFGGSAEPQAAPLKPAAARSATVDQAAVQQAAAPGPALVFLGSYRDGGQSAYLLQADGQDVVARIGDTIAGAYRLDAAQEGALSLTYLPGSQPMTITLATGDAN